MDNEKGNESLKSFTKTKNKCREKWNAFYSLFICIRFIYKLYAKHRHTQQMWPSHMRVHDVTNFYNYILYSMDHEHTKEKKNKIKNKRNRIRVAYHFISFHYLLYIWQKWIAAPSQSVWIHWISIVKFPCICICIVIIMINFMNGTQEGKTENRNKFVRMCKYIHVNRCIQK